MQEIEEPSIDEPEYTPWLYPFACNISVFRSNEPVSLVPSHHVSCSTGIVVSGVAATEVQISLGQHQLDLSNLDTERLVFPGGGDPLENCGDKRGHINCIDEGRWLHDIYEHCDRPECPICTDTWRKRAAESATKETIDKFNLARGEINGRFTLSSVIWSSPADLWNASQEKLWSAYAHAMRRAGVVAAVSVLHLFRFRDSRDEDIPWNTYKMNPGAYSVVRQPHFHSIIIGYLMNSDKFENATRWIYKKTNSKCSRDDVFCEIFYALSHTQVSLDRQRQLVHYHGLFKKARILEEWVEYVDVLCPYCGGPTEVHYVVPRIIDGCSVLNFRERYTRAIIHRIYTFEPPPKPI